MAVECEFQALTLAEAQEEMQAYEAQSHKPIQGRGWPTAMKPSSPGFSKGVERIDGPTPMMIMVIMPQDRWPWTRITLPLVDSFLEGRSGMSHRDKMLTSQDITQRTVS